MNFISKKVLPEEAIAIAAKSGIQVDEDETNIILDFLYLIAKNFSKPLIDPAAETLKRNRTREKAP